MKFTKRRIFLKAAGGLVLSAGLPGLSYVYAQDSRVTPKSPPVWTGFGLNGGPGQARYELSRRYLQKHINKEITDPQAFAFMNKTLRAELSQQSPRLVDLDKTEVNIGEDYLVGMVHDYEVAIPFRRVSLKEQTKEGNILTFMSGAGLIMTYQKSVGWRVVSSFSFASRDQRNIADIGTAKEAAVDLLGDAYKTHARAFATFLARFGKWNGGYRSNYFARVVSAKIGKVAKPQLQEYKLEELFTSDYLGFQASAAICDALDIPMLPFKSSDAMEKRFATKFSEARIADDKIVIPDSDLDFEVLLLKATKEKISSAQQGRIIIRRRLYLGMRVIDKSSGEKLLEMIAADPEDEDVLRIDTPEDDTPERDFVFFDRLLNRTMTKLLKAIVKNDAAAINALGVKYEDIAPAIPKLMKLCANAR